MTLYVAENSTDQRIGVVRAKFSGDPDPPFPQDDASNSAERAAAATGAGVGNGNKRNRNRIGDFHYSIGAGDPHGHFRVDPLTGQLFRHVSPIFRWWGSRLSVIFAL